MNYTELKTKYHLHLDAQQERAVQAVDGPVLLLAVPGSGKTTTLVARIGYMLYGKNIHPEQILTMTYTVAAARDMRERFAVLFGGSDAERLEFRTINSVCSRIIRFYEQKTGRTAFRLFDDWKQRSALLADLCRRQNNEYATESTINALETAITYVKNQMLKGEALEQVDVEGINFPPIYRAYCQTLRERHLMDYDDQMVYALQILQQYPAILKEVQRRYQYFCVDEAQDTSKIQHCIIQLLASGSGNLFMVGDEDQSIYGFRAAYPQALTQFEQTYPKAKVLYMEQNYRSTKQIVAAADRFIQKNRERHPKHMKSTRGDGPGLKEIQVRDRNRQYSYLCKVARDCTVETAVLYRDNDSVLPLIDRLDREGIAYRARQVNSAFFTNRVVRDISDIIHLAQDPYDGERFLNVYYKLGAGISRAVAQESVSRSGRVGQRILEYICGSQAASPWTKKQCRSLQTHMDNLVEEQADRAVYRIVHFMGYGAYLEEHGIDPNKAEILEALGANQPTPQHLLERLEELQQVVQAGSAAASDCPFVLSTIHSSKGLEYERVILMDVMDGILPSIVPGNHPAPEEIETYEEERRLFYVGMTRAKQQLSLFTFQKESLKSVFASELFGKPKDSAPVKLVRTEQTKKHPLQVRPQPKGKQTGAISQAYVPNTRIIHKAFGAGTLLFRSGDIAMIDFDDGKDRKLSLSTALRMGQIELE